MPGARGKTKAKRPKPKVPCSLAKAASEEFTGLIDDIEGAEGWNMTVNVLCEFLQLPGGYAVLNLRVHSNF